MTRKCTYCRTILRSRYKIKFCSNKCQAMMKHQQTLDEWKNGIKSGTVGVQSRIISSSLRRYLFEKYGHKCSRCGWNEVNIYSGKVPLEIDHIDGNSENNSEHNLRLLCPNCHSLTPYFRNLNRGRGRKWRMDKYNRNRVAL